MATIINGDGIVTAEGTSTTQGRLRLGEDTDNGSNYVELQAAANIASNVTFTLPSADGTSGQVLQTNGSGTLSFATAASASLSEFTSSGTWTKPSGANFVMVEAWGAGGGGGSGRRAATGSDRFGGGGAGGGAYAYRLFKASDLTSTVTVTVGAGGSGGAAVTVDSTSGNNGTIGGNTTFGSYLTAYGGNVGQGGSASSGQAGLGGGVLSNTEPRAGYPASGNAAGHFGAANGSSGASQSSGFGGGSGGASSTTNGGAGGSSYQGGAGGGAGSGFNSNGATANSGAGGGTSGSSGTGPSEIYYPGVSGTAGSGRQGGAGGTSGYSQVSYASPSALAFGNSTFAIATGYGKILTSSNGTTGWAYVATPSNLGIFWLMHDGTQFVLFDYYATRCWTTTDFVSYTEKTGLPTLESLFRVKYQNSNYFICTSSGLYRSTNLNSWTLISTGLTRVNDICWSGTNYVAVSELTPFVRYSSDLTTWSTSTGNASAYQAVSNGSGTVVISTSSSPNAKRSTDNGASFTDVATTLGNNYDNVLGFANSTYFFSDSGASIWTSTDGNSWTIRVTATGDVVTGLAYNGTTYVTAVIASQSTIAARTSTPAALGTWTNRSVTARNVAGGTGGAGGQPAGGGGGGGASANGSNSGAGGAGGDGLVRVYTW